MKNLDQRTLSERNEIFNTIKETISNAKNEIQVVSAWFTDPELFELLLQKQASGIKVSVIISDQKDNEKLPFHKLANAGGRVKKVKNSGYGVMHQKFCVVDSEVAIHGSYNWTLNARKNNHESVIITNHQNTVKEMKDLFNKLMTSEGAEGVTKPKRSLKRAISALFRSSSENIEPQVKEEEPVLVAEPKQTLSTNIDYRLVLDNILNSEVNEFDREDLKSTGYRASKMSGGDPRVIQNSLDAVYAGLLNDVTITEEKLSEIKTRIEFIRKKTNTQIENQKILRKNSIESVSSLQLNERLTRLDQINVDIEKKELLLEKQKESKKGISTTISSLVEKMQSLKKEHIENKPSKAPLYVFGILGVLALVSTFIFYTSAAYILLFSEKDAMDATLMGQLPDLPEVFDHLALFKAWEKGWTAILLMLAVFAFLTIIAMAKVFRKKTDSSIFTSAGIIGGILIVDGFLAAKVSESIHKVNYMIGNEVSEYDWSSIFTDWNFYKVFLLGAGVLLALQIAVGYIKAYFDELKEDKGAVKFKKEKEFLMEQKETQEKCLEEAEQLEQEIKLELLELDGEVKNLERDVQVIKVDTEREVQLVDQTSDLKISELETYADLLIAKMESGRLPFSTESIRERVAVFFEGWNEFLHEHFASAVATEKLKEADEQKRSWLDSKDSNKGGNYIAA